MFKSALDYHNHTSYDRYNMQGHYMDWPNQPTVFKQYSGIEPIPLVPGDNPKKVSIAQLCLTEPTGRKDSTSIYYSLLSDILTLTHAITAKAKHGGSYFYYRSVASAGALYPFESYVCALGVKGLDPGLFHHNLAANGLEKLVDGASISRIRDILNLENTIRPSLVFFLTSIFFRSSWKYRDRAYRYHLLDTGHLLENLTLALKYKELEYSIVTDFDDDKTNGFLGIDPKREVCLVAVCVGSCNEVDQTETSSSNKPVVDLSSFSKVSEREITYSVIEEIHQLTRSNRTEPDFNTDRIGDLGLELRFVGSVDSLEIPEESLKYPDAVFARRSLRNFVKKELSLNEIGYMLRVLGASEAITGASSEGVQIGFIASNVQKAPKGFYIYNPDSHSLFLARQDSIMDEMTHICLDQGWLSNCAAHFLMLVNMTDIERRFGPRGYRRALLTAGRLGQRLYLTTTSLKLGCCGIGAFYDAEARKLLGLNEHSRLTYLLGVGPLKKRSINE